MIEFLSSWAQGIIVAVIIATLIEMILPNSSSKKYVKVVIGMYILFTIVSPIIKKLGGKDINLNTIDIEKYEQQISKSDNTISRKFEDNNTRSIKDIYVSNLKADISAKLKEKGYEIDTSDIQIKDDENYTIVKITLKLIKMEQKQEKQAALEEECIKYFEEKLLKNKALDDIWKQSVDCEFTAHGIRFLGDVYALCVTAEAKGKEIKFSCHLFKKNCYEYIRRSK